MRLGLCCLFQEQSIKFRVTTAKHLLTLSATERLAKLSMLCLHNADALLKALSYCDENGIGSFRINSRVLPVKTHPEVGYQIQDLPGSDAIVAIFKACGDFAKTHDVRTTFHPDQFVLLNSPRQDVIDKSIEELIYQAEVAEWVNADVINLHGGGAYGDKASALAHLVQTIETLPESVRGRLTLENDDRTYTPTDLLPVCRQTGVPLVYDVHHHRCNPDDLTIAQATEAAMGTWNRQPLFHISSPKEGWSGPKPARHHDFINPLDFPDCWKNLDITVDIEAKAKEVAIERLISSGCLNSDC